MPTAPGPRRTLRRRASVCLLLGLVTNVTVASLCAWRVRYLDSAPDSRWGERIVGPRGEPLPPPDDGQEPPNSQFLEFKASDGTGVTFAFSRLRPFQNFTPASTYPRYPTPESAAHAWERALLLPWLSGRREWPDPAKGESIWIKASGWPLRSFRCELHVKDNWVPAPGGTPTLTGHTWSAPGGLILGSPDGPSWADWPPDFPIIIPGTPIWSGVLVNTALFALAWALALYPVASLRRARRRRLGLCERCAYDRRGLPPQAACPECGVPRTSSQGSV
jgi:hypothetical protein